MMKITRDNYESWFLDYLEGNLEEKMMDEFIQFIMENPDLKAELQGYEPVGPDKGSLPFPDKNKLYKESYDIPEIFNETAVAMMEGDLKDSVAADFTCYLRNHPEKEREMELFSQTKLIPDLSVEFRNKNRLYHHPVVILYTRQLLRIAAILFLAMMLFPLIEKQPPYSDNAGIKTVTLSDPYQQKQEVVRMEEKKIRNASASEKTPPPTLPGDLMSTVPPIRNDLPGVLASTDPVRMVLIPQNEPNIRTYVFEIEYYALVEPAQSALSDRIIRKIGLPQLNMAKITRWGLNKVSDLSNDKFSYTTNPEGEIIAYNVDTRLLGLSIPSKNK